MTRARVALSIALGLLLAVAAASVGMAAARSSGGQGRLYGLSFPDHIAWAQTQAKLGQPYSIAILTVCAQHAPVRITTVRPMATVGKMTLDRAGLSAPYGPNQRLAPSPGFAFLPASWNLHRSVTECGKVRYELALQVTRRGPESAGFLGIEVDYLDEKGGKRTARAPNLVLGLCGNNKNARVSCR